MSCATCRSQMLELPIDAIARELGPHLAACPDCARIAEALIADERVLHAALDAWLDRPPPAVGELAPHLTQARRPSMFESLHLLALAGAAAAALLLGVRFDNGGPAPITASVTAASVVEAIDADVRRIARVEWHHLTEEEWAEAATLLLEGYARLPADAPRALRFRVLAEMGRAAENASREARPPFYQEAAGRPVSAAYYLAARLAREDPTLLEGLREPHALTIRHYADQLDAGALPDVPLDLSP